MLNALSADASAGHPVIDAPEGPLLDSGRLHAEHDAFLAGLPCRGQAKYLRRRGAEQLLAAHPGLAIVGDPTHRRPGRGGSQAAGVAVSVLLFPPAG
jgi:hypothetical protein